MLSLPSLRLPLRHLFEKSPRAAAHPTPWPAGFDPKKNPVFARSEVFIPAPPDEVFRALTDQRRWPEYLGRPGKIDIKSGTGPGETLKLGTRYEWNFIQHTKNEVLLFEPGRAIGWTATSAGTKAFHRWILVPVPGGTRLITEECQHGPAPKLFPKSIGRVLQAVNAHWLHSLKDHIVAGRARAPVDQFEESGVKKAPVAL